MEPNKSMTIPQLIRFLKACSNKVLFEKVQDILLQRESELNKQIQELNGQNNMLEGRLVRIKRQQMSEREEIELWKMKYRELAFKVPEKTKAKRGGERDALGELTEKVDEHAVITKQEVACDNGIAVATPNQGKRSDERPKWQRMPTSEKNTTSELIEIASDLSGDKNKTFEKSPERAMVLYNQPEPFDCFVPYEQLTPISLSSSTSMSLESLRGGDFESSPKEVIEPKKSKVKSGMKRKSIQKESTINSKKPKNVKEDEKTSVKSKTPISDQQEETKVTKIRTSPKVFTDMVSGLSEVQKEWVKHAGFGTLLDFSLKELPHKLGYNVLEAFDHASVTLRLTGGNITISEQDVAEVLGMPLGYREIKLGSKNNAVVEEWRGQFIATAPHKITANAVCSKIKESGEVTLMFKMNFLVVMMNTLVESLGNPYVSQRIINFQGDVDESAEYNWCALVIESLVDSKPIWQEDPNKRYYTGPLIFLILLYVDRVLYKGRRLVDRKCPTFMGWTTSLLRERHVEELKSNSFGRGTISKSLREGALHLRQAAEDSYTTMGVDTIEKDCINRLEKSAAQLVSAKTKYDADLMTAKTLVPENPRLKEIISMITMFLGIANASQGTKEAPTQLGTIVNEPGNAKGDARVLSETVQGCAKPSTVHRRTSQECRKGKHLRLWDATKEAVVKRKRESYSSSSSEDSSSSSDTEYELEKNSSINKPWKSEKEMFLAIQTNAELSMKAVCALYKEHTSSKNSAGHAFSSQIWGFKETYAHRGQILGEFLTDRNLECKLVKSVRELCLYDPNALGECKKIAVEHNKQLFEIYRMNGYTFFH